MSKLSLAILVVLVLHLANSSILRIPAIGRSSDLGFFYNSREGQFYPVSALSGPVPRKSIVSHLKTNVECTSKIVKSLDDRLNSIGLSLRAKVDVMTGLLETSGAISYAKNTRFERGSTYGVVHYKRTTMYETFQPRHPDVRSTVSMHPGEVLGATDVVLGMTSGVNVIVSFEFKNKKNTFSSSTEVELEASLNKLAYSVGFGANVENKNSTIQSSTEVEIKIFGDLLIPSIPKTIEDVEALLQNIPAIMEATSDKGSPQSYDVIEIEKLQQILNYDAASLITLPSIAISENRSPDIIELETLTLLELEEAEETFTDAQMWKTRIQGIEFIFEREFLKKLNKMCLMYQSTYEVYISKFKANLQICQGNLTAASKKEFFSVKKEYSNHKWGPKKTQKHLDSILAAGKAKYHDYHALKQSGVIYASRHLTLNQLRLENRNQTITFLLYTAGWKSQNTDMWNRLTNWLSMEKGIRYIVDCQIRLHASTSCKEVGLTEGFQINRYDENSNKAIFIPTSFVETYKKLNFG